MKYLLGGVLVRLLIEHLPEHFKGILEFQEIMKTAQVEIDLLRSEIFKLLDNQFVEKSDTETIKRLEKIYGIKNTLGDIEDRRFALLLAMLEKRPSSIGFVKKQLEIICGKDGFEVIEDYSGYCLEIRLALGKKEHIEIVENLLRDIMPCNMTLVVDMLYSRYGDMDEKRHDFLDEFNHDEIKEEFI